MNLYRISQNWNTGYDTYDSAVVAAESEDEARLIHPSEMRYSTSSWCDPAAVEVTLIGKAVDGTISGVICASYNAG